MVVAMEDLDTSGGGGGIDDPLLSPFSEYDFANQGFGINTTVDGADISIVAGNEVLNFENVSYYFLFSFVLIVMVLFIRLLRLLSVINLNKLE